ncbi:von Willebrand factor A domain-containing protein 1-like [Nematolebias whitei]|uniref:von Willebrand factor A domain-containing protein 1-like n=1 Tax=Nematolebias whitei TaxID=451745 RepID=UPI00189B10EB|nr:von Willebrand factor A domain-containing protein 1-like [Nematolebias whitei]
MSALNFCQGDLLLLLDSSGSVTNFEFSCFLLFAADLLCPFSLGRGHVRVALLQVGTSPHLEFSLEGHDKQESLEESLQEALRGVNQLQGDTNTATHVAQQLLLKTRQDVPKLLLWLTDGVQPGAVEKPMSELKARGVSVLVVYTMHGNHQVLKRVVTPPVESHLYSVDIDSIDIITEDLREAIVRIVCAEQLSVVHLTSRSAVLQWRPFLTVDSGYELHLNSVSTNHPEIRKLLPRESSRAELSDLQPETRYAASLHPKSNNRLVRPPHFLV